MISLACYFAWIATFTMIECTCGVHYRMMQEWAGLPTFVLGCLLVVCVVRSSPVEEPAKTN